MKYPLDDDFKFPLKKLEPISSTLFSNNDDNNYIYSLFGDLSDVAKQQIQDGGSYRIVMYGTATYMDAFGESHFTNVCWTYRLYGDIYATTRCATHNDSN